MNNLFSLPFLLFITFSMQGCHELSSATYNSSVDDEAQLNANDFATFIQDHNAERVEYYSGSQRTITRISEIKRAYEDNYDSAILIKSSVRDNLAGIADEKFSNENKKEKFLFMIELLVHNTFLKEKTSFTHQTQIYQECYAHLNAVEKEVVPQSKITLEPVSSSSNDHEYDPEHRLENSFERKALFCKYLIENHVSKARRSCLYDEIKQSVINFSRNTTHPKKEINSLLLFSSQRNSFEVYLLGGVFEKCCNRFLNNSEKCKFEFD